MEGIFQDISNEEYHGGEGISKSHLDVVSRSTQHYYWEYLSGLYERPAPSDSLNIGSAVHCAILEPEKYGDLFAVAPKVDKRTKAGKEQWEEFQEKNEGKTLLNNAQNFQVNGAVEAVRNHDVAKYLFKDGKAEQSVYWKDPVTGLLCKCRPDYQKPGFIIDLKTTQASQPQEFCRSIAKFRYHVQAAWYRAGWHRAANEVVDFVFVAVETTPPFECRVYHADSSMIGKGEELYMRDLDTLAKCFESEDWKAPARVEPISIPRWAMFE